MSLKQGDAASVSMLTLCCLYLRMFHVRSKSLMIVLVRDDVCVCEVMVMSLFVRGDECVFEE